MRFYTITLTATNTPATLASLIEAGIADNELTLFQRKKRSVMRIALYSEGGNAAAGVRFGKGTGLDQVDIVAADAGAGDDAVTNGFPIAPGASDHQLFGPCGHAAPYSCDAIYVAGTLGDVLQVGIVTL